MATKECDKRIVIIGAGSQSFGLGTLGDLMTIGQKLSGATVVLHDKSEEMLKLVGDVFGLALKQASEDGDPAPFKMEATTDPVKALQGADYVVMSIEHGNRLKTWEQDYYVPFRHGCTPIYSENGGPGGAFHTWRACPGSFIARHSSPLAAGSPRSGRATHSTCWRGSSSSFSTPGSSWSAGAHTGKHRSSPFTR